MPAAFHRSDRGIAIAAVGESYIAATGSPEKETRGSRVVALDLTKGMLVVCMVIYHSLNYSTQRQLGFKYLAFLPPSFILITGFLLSSIYLARYTLNDWGLHGRLIARGLKLLLLFTVLNVLVQKFVGHALRGQVPGLAYFWGHWFDTYVSGNGRIAVFEVLLPIAYLLLLAPVLLVINRVHWIVLPVLTVAVMATLVILEYQGIAWFNPQLLSAGLAGMLLGRVPLQRLNRLGDFRIVALVIYGACFACAYTLGENYLLQFLGAVLALALFYGISVKLSPGTWIAKRVQMLGRYSLIAYVGQIMILQTVSRWIGHPEPDSVLLLIMFASALIFTSVLVEGTDWLRPRVNAADVAYKVVFG